MSRFLEALHSGRVLLMDGAMGTELIRAGLDISKERCEQWNFTNPERVKAVHRACAEAGATVLLTNTFQSHVAFARRVNQRGPNSPAFEVENERWHRECQMASEHARVGGTNYFVLGSVGPISSEDVEHFPTEEEPEVSSKVKAAMLTAAQMKVLEAETDATLLETQWSLLELTWVVRIDLYPDVLARLIPRDSDHPKPILISFAFQKDGRKLLVHRAPSTPEEVADWANQQRPRITALGVNCGRDIGIDEVLEILERYRKVTDLPLFVRPNAGTPTRTADGYSYPLTPEKLAARLPELLKAGIAMFGGCCGTTPAHIAACRPIIDEWNREHAPTAKE